MKKFILPVALFVFGAGAAFATNTAKPGEAATENGYRITSNPMEPCQKTEVKCSTIPSQELCTDGSVTLHRIGETSCGSDLFKL
ncbi:DUF6520 family protein [Kaistella sp. 97-N-M2]|uniref:DUF6520 family protein n=1 Tax=Kaistella sp. 97-N-M2 TaxID=2908645 RepID=UPI001F1C717E|nr:DUF6520 family protein [Kaistella sp. 97-N-M2]UJF28795.1 DUF6520 family protein [Kaistella sp. 97-N-M2]